MTFKQWLRTNATKEFRGLMKFDRMAVKAMEAAWNAGQQEVYKVGMEEIEKHQAWCNVNNECNCGAEQ